MPPGDGQTLYYSNQLMTRSSLKGKARTKKSFGFPPCHQLVAVVNRCRSFLILGVTLFGFALERDGLVSSVQRSRPGDVNGRFYALMGRTTLGMNSKSAFRRRLVLSSYG